MLTKKKEELDKRLRKYNKLSSSILRIIRTKSSYNNNNRYATINTT